MPTQKSVHGKTKVNGGRMADDVALEELVAAIEGRNIKAGCTKSQKEKSLQNALGRAQGRDAAARKVTRLQEQFIRNMRALEMNNQSAEYVNKEIALAAEHTTWKKIAPNKYVRYEQFKGTDEEMNFIVNFFSEMLTEPYSSFTYQYFVFGWPDLCITAYGVESSTPPDSGVIGEKVGAIVSRVTRKGLQMPLRGYVAMFAVAKHFRGVRLGRRLVSLTVELMKAKGCDEVYLETPITSTRALELYLNLGFAKTKFLPRYYLDHSDAVRMKLWLKDAFPKDVTKDAVEE